MLPKRQGAFVANPVESTPVRRAERSSYARLLPTTCVVNAHPSFFSETRTCEACGSTSLTHGRLSASELDRVEMYACDECGDFWFERSGMRLSADALRSLGLLHQ